MANREQNERDLNMTMEEKVAIIIYDLIFIDDDGVRIWDRLPQELRNRCKAVVEILTYDLTGHW